MELRQSTPLVRNPKANILHTDSDRTFNSKHPTTTHRTLRHICKTHKLLHKSQPCKKAVIANARQTILNTNDVENSSICYLYILTILKKILLTVLCLQFLFPNDLLQDIVRLPVLVAHYFHHNHAAKHVHFTDFIAEHYSNHEHHNEDHDQHDNLPFHNHGLHFQQGIFTVTVLEIFQTGIPDYSITNPNDKIIIRQHFYSSTALSSIWRPPKPA
jgi:hypothetical protein